MDSQRVIVLNHLRTFGTITSIEAFRMYGITRLADVIFRLRKNYNISRIDTVGTNRYGKSVRFATYKLNGENN